MMTFVIDTNVLVVANNQSNQADLVCQQSCIVFLGDVRRNHGTLIDDQYRIMSEYGNNLDPRRQPGVGMAFFKWLHTHMGSARCKQIPLRPVPASPNDFEEFPDDPALTSFDRSDRKYVAVAIASNCNPEIANAVDSDWAQHHVPLQRNGIQVRFLCEHHCSPKEEDKNGNHQ